MVDGGGLVDFGGAAVVGDGGAVLVADVFGDAQIVPGGGVLLLIFDGSEEELAGDVVLVELEAEDAHLVKDFGEIAAAGDGVAVVVEGVFGEAAGAEDVSGGLEFFGAG